MFKPLFFAAMVLAFAAPALAQPIEITPDAQVRDMGPGINVAAGWDPYWDGNPSSNFKLSYIDTIKAAGFRTIRVPITTFRHMDAQGHLDPATFKRLDAIVDAGVKAGLNVIIDEHDYDDCPKDVDACAVILPNVWYELSEHYKNAPPAVMFELLNEPHAAVDDKIWNGWLPDLIDIIRQTNPTRNIIVGPTHWNSKNDLPLLKLPENDRHIIVTFHYYDPFHFTHQGASWAGDEVKALHDIEWKGSPAELAQLNADFDQVAAWAKANNRPILLGEYGTYGKANPRMDQRAAWTKAVSRAAADRGFARAFWYFSEGPQGFTAYDTDKKQWVAPIKDALLGQ
ncbi:MAG: glycoside hydrolase family 5 protein [Asticcacaulis sp.]|nr:glycoside hydrolase family 5 protein [Asticcacaulis sp.]